LRTWACPFTWKVKLEYELPFYDFSEEAKEIRWYY